MNNIIAQILVRMQEGIIKKIHEKGLADIGAVAEEILGVLKAGSCELLSGILEATDQEIAGCRAMRKADGLKVKERNVGRTLLTTLGELNYHRTYYETDAGERVYLLDYLIGIEPYERVSKALCAKLVNLAEEMSYSRSVKAGEAAVSRQTVCNKVNGLKEVVTDVERLPETPKVLHIFTDEDHVHLNNGKSVMVPIATISEGIDVSNPKRHELIRPLHIAGYGMDGETFNDQVEACLNERYDINAVENIYVHGDGAARIVSLGERFPNACHVLDGFHLEKYMKKLGHYEGASQRIGTLRTALKEGKWDSCKKLLNAIYALQDDKHREKCKKVIAYLWKHRRAIQLRLSLDICGSCTESIVSHVLSERLSRSPLAWSERGLQKMAMLRVYAKNGGVVSSKDIRVSLSKEDAKIESATLRNGWSKYNHYMEHQIGLILNTDWSTAFSSSHVSFGKVDAAFVIRKALGSVRSIA